MDTEDSGFATGLSTCLLKDGTQNPTANLPMNGFAHTGVANATAANQYAVVSQIQNSSYNWIAGGGTADAITATYSPAITALVDGMELDFRATAANATTTPTFAPNGLTAHTITKKGGTALAANDIAAALFEGKLRYNLANTRWELLNPAVSVVIAATPITNSLSGDVALNNTGTYFDGPSVAQGTTGTWFVSGTVSLTDTGAAARFFAKLWDGTTLIAVGQIQIPAASVVTSLSLSGYLASPAGNLRISVEDTTNTTGKILFNNSGLSKDSTITAIRIA